MALDAIRRWRYRAATLNGRPVEDRALSRAILQASRDAIRTDRHPAVFLYLSAKAGAVKIRMRMAAMPSRVARTRSKAVGVPPRWR